MVSGGRYTLDPRHRRFPSILHALAHAAERQPDRPGLAVPGAGGDRVLGYAQYAAAVAAMARRFQAQGVRGKAVAVVMGNGLEASIALMGAMAAGALAAPVNPNYTPAELEPLLKDVGPHVLCCDPEQEQRLRPIAARLGVPHVAPLPPATVEGLLREPPAPLPLPAAADASVMFFTGGTTGLPKGAAHTHSTLMAYCYGVGALWPLEFGVERVLNVAPLFHIWGFCFTLVYPVYIGATMHLLPAYKPGEVLAAFERHRITVFAGGPPTMYVGLRAHENYRKTDFSSIRWCMSGGAPCSEELLRAWREETGSTILEGIGMSEGAPIAQMPMRGAHKVRSVGVVGPDTEVEVVDLETGTKVLPPGQAGEIRVKGPQFIKGYRNRPEETAKAFRDGWLYTGDIGYFDEDDYLFVVDRKKEMILVGGYNVYPREIDEVLAKHPAILEVATVGVPDSFSGEAVKSYVALKPGASLDKASLEAYCKERLVKYKLPKHIEFLDTLPKTGVGKINKLDLKARG
ncbi:MAG: AMP-binding protein [Alphaproteobacteria bacterium]